MQLLLQKNLFTKAQQNPITPLANTRALFCAHAAALPPGRFPKSCHDRGASCPRCVLPKCMPFHAVLKIQRNCPRHLLFLRRPHPLLARTDPRPVPDETERHSAQKHADKVREPDVDVGCYTVLSACPFCCLVGSGRYAVFNFEIGTRQSTFGIAICCLTPGIYFCPAWCK